MDNASGSTVFYRCHSKPGGVNIVDLNDNQDFWLDYDAANRVTVGGLVEDGIFQIWGWTWDRAGNRPTETQAPAGGSTTTRT